MNGERRNMDCALRWSPKQREERRVANAVKHYDCVIDDLRRSVRRTVGAISDQLPATIRIAIGTVLSAGLLIIGCMPKVPVLQFRRETGQNMLGWGPRCWAAANGSLLGIAVVSRIGFWLWYLVPVGCFVVGSPIHGALIWGTYGLVRGITISLSAFVMRNSPERMTAISMALLSRQPRAVAVSRAALVILGVGMTLVLGA